MRLSFLSGLLLLLVGFQARADTISSFTYQSDFTGGYSTQGSVSIDTTSGRILSGDISLYENQLLEATFTQPDYSQPVQGVYLAEFPSATSGYKLELLLPNSTLVHYTGGSVCTVSQTCDGYPSGVVLPNGSYATAEHGSLAATPEPSSLLLLGTGALLFLVIFGGPDSRKGTRDPG